MKWRCLHSARLRFRCDRSNQLRRQGGGIAMKKSPTYGVDRQLTRCALGSSIRAILQRGLDLSRFTSAGGLLLGTLSAHAQSVPAATAAKAAVPSQSIEEIIVTARRRNESVQDVPYNITAVDAATIQRTGAITLNDLTRVISGLTTVDEGPGARGGTN